MSNTASKELCEQLFELSGWGDTDKDWRYYSHRDAWSIEDYSNKAEATLPAYDFGYLLRKLPATIKGRLNSYMLQMSKINDTRYTMHYTDSQERIHNNGGGFAHGSTPEDAAAKLAIELLKSGVLTSEHKAAKPLASTPVRPVEGADSA